MDYCYTETKQKFPCIKCQVRSVATLNRDFEYTYVTLQTMTHTLPMLYTYLTVDMNMTLSMIP